MFFPKVCLFLSAAESRSEVDRIRGKKREWKQGIRHLPNSALGRLVFFGLARFKWMLCRPGPWAQEKYVTVWNCFFLHKVAWTHDPPKLLGESTVCFLFLLLDNCAVFCFSIVVLLFLILGSNWHKLDLPRKREPQLRKCSYQIGLYKSLPGIFLIDDWCARTQLTGNGAILRWWSLVVYGSRQGK